MDPSARNPAAPGAVTAALTYLVDTGEKPVNYPSVAGEDGVSRWEGRHGGVVDRMLLSASAGRGRRFCSRHYTG